MKRYLLLVLVGVLSTTLQAQKVDYEKFGIDTKYEIPKGLKKGDKAPDFTGVNQLGKTVNLKQMLNNGPVAVVFYRGAWCFYCSRHLAELQDGFEELTEQGIQLVAITPDAQENIDDMVALQELNFAIISDIDLNIMKDYKVAFHVTDAYNAKLRTDIRTANASGEQILPIPATFVIGENGKIIKRFFNLDYSKRSSVADILNSIR